MQELSEQLQQVRSSATTLSACLMILAGLLAGAGLLTGGVHLILTAVEDEVNLLNLLQAVGWLLLGATSATFAWAAGWLVRRQYESSVFQQRLLDALGQSGSRPPGGAAAGAASDEAEILKRMLGELETINSSLLLSPAQREARSRRHLAKVGEQLAVEVEQAIEADDFAEAERVLARLAAELPASQRHHELRAQLEQARTDARVRDIRDGTAEANDLMAASHFEQAEKVAENLLNRHPTATEAIALVDRVRRETSTFVTEGSRRLFARIDRDVEAHRWHAALKAAESFLENYPDCPEADLIRAQMPTLTDNALIEDARRLRDDVLDMIEHRRFAEAVKAAKELIENFPETMAAGELREQLPQLTKLANEGANNNQ